MPPCRPVREYEPAVVSITSMIAEPEPSFQNRPYPRIVDCPASSPVRALHETVISLSVELVIERVGATLGALLILALPVL